MNFGDCATSRRLVDSTTNHCTACIRYKRHTCCWSALHSLPPVLRETGWRGPGHDEDGSILCFATKLGVVVSHVPSLPGPLVCVNIDNNRWCPGACMQFFSVSNVQVYSLPPVALRRLRGLVESGACEQWRNVAGGWWSPDTGDNVLADRPHQYTSQSPVCNMHTATDTQTARQNYRSTSIAFHE